MTHVGLLERLLPRPRRDLLGYASARLLEALAESLLALVFLEKGYTRNAAGKAFQAWRALTAAVLALEYGRIREVVRGEEQRRWLVEKAVPRVPSTRLKMLGQLVERLGYDGYTHYTSTALDLHDYQYHGPDPDAELSKYTSRREAAGDIIYLLERLVEVLEKRVKQKLVEAGAWTKEHEDLYEAVRKTLERSRNSDNL